MLLWWWRAQIMCTVELSPEDSTPSMHVFSLQNMWQMSTSKTSCLFSSSSLQFPHHFRILVLNFPTSGLTHAWRHAWRQSCRQKQRTRKPISHRMKHTFIKCSWPRKRFSIDSWIKHGFTAKWTCLIYHSCKCQTKLQNIWIHAESLQRLLLKVC